jgi:putative oxidoreductase
MDIVELVGRLVFAGLFVYYGIAHFTRFQAFSGYARAKGTPAAGLAVGVTGLMLLAGGVLIALGAWADLGALMLVAFLLPVAFAIHPFWRERDPLARAGEEASFLKDVALGGAALTLFALYHEVGDAAAYTLTGPLF